MTFKNLFIEHELSPEVEAWIKQEVAEQEERYRAVSGEMEDLAPMREKWYQEFFDRITTTGFNDDGDMNANYDNHNNGGYDNYDPNMQDNRGYLS